MGKRIGASTRDLIITNLVAIVAGLVLSGFLLLFLDINPIQVYSSAIKTLFTDRYMAAEVFLKATPFILPRLHLPSPTKPTCSISELKDSSI